MLKSCTYVIMIKFGTLAIKFVKMIKLYSGHDDNMFIWPGTIHAEIVPEDLRIPGTVKLESDCLLVVCADPPATSGCEVWNLFQLLQWVYTCLLC